MSPLKDTTSPTAVCWDRASRTEVMDTIALNVRDSVFRATHSPSFLQQQGARQGTYVPLKESEFLADFLNVSHNHVFNVAVGDSGTGKSHLIKWMYYEIKRRIQDAGAPYWLVLVPRSSSNLADVVGRVISGFHGEIATRLAEDLKQQHKLELGEARNRVVDELAYVLEQPVVPRPGEAPEGEEEELVRGGLPALVRDHALRAVLLAKPDGIVTRVARHVLGQREGSAEETDLRWKPSDFEFTAAQAEKAGPAARELCHLLRDDDRLRAVAASMLNKSQALALRQLLRFKSGDMKAALAEVRQELLGQGKELILLIEDLSITEGLDAELVEALQVRTRDTGTELCRLRTIVGVTNDDYARMRENIQEGRTLRTVFFNMPVVGSGGEGVTRSAIVRFASRYLNAARFSIAELDHWNTAGQDELLPSACDECSARVKCHKAFGAEEGRGLFPFSPDALARLYDQVASARAHVDRAFNPRMLVGRVINGVLEEAEQSLPSRHFPRATLMKSFDLNGVRAEVEIELRRFGAEAPRLQRALDLYSPDPSAAAPVLGREIAESLGLPVPTLAMATATDVVPVDKPTPQSIPATAKPPTRQPVVPSLDIYDRWRQGDDLPDSDLNRWRMAVHSAVCGWIEWDIESLAHVQARFKNVGIQFEGQHTKPIKTDVTLDIGRSPDTAVTLRVLIEGLDRSSSGASEKQLLLVRTSLETWGSAVREQVLRIASEAGSPGPLQVAARTLALGALLRGIVVPEAPVEDLLSGLLTPWPETRPSHRSPQWGALWDAYARRSEEVRLLLAQALACSKGARPGPFINPAPILLTLQGLGSGKLAEPPAISAGQWNLWKGARDLASDVAKTLTPAMDVERGVLEEHEVALAAALGAEDVRDVARQVQAACQAAVEAAVFRTGGVPGVKVEEAERWANQDSKPRIQELVALRSATGTTQLALLAKIDPNYFKDLRRFLETASAICKSSLKYAEEQMHAIGGGTDPVELQAEVMSLIKSIEKDLDSLGEAH